VVKREESAVLSDENELVAAARTGDVQAFGELIERHRGACVKRAMLMIRNRTAAEDEVQNAFWKAFQRLDQFRREGDFAACLSRIVENQCLMRIREERSSRFVDMDELSESDLRAERLEHSSAPEGQLGRDDVVSLLRREIARIPPLLRNAIVLRDLDQLSMPEVANRLGRLMRARMELRNRITKHLRRKGSGQVQTGLVSKDYEVVCKSLRDEFRDFLSRDA
jgi:RNA polymerase sigma-70 factor, ECF subfamily